MREAEIPFVVIKIIKIIAPFIFPIIGALLVFFLNAWITKRSDENRPFNIARTKFIDAAKDTA
jgi:hypothetical protein